MSPSKPRGGAGKEQALNRSETTACERMTRLAGAVADRHARRGFTLMEMMVAVGAIAVLSVGIASVFSTIGKTVSGGRRISQLTAQAAQIENAMRQDFARMTRDGFLMVRQQLTNTGGPRGGGVRKVALTATDTSSRVRRIDEILFFAKGHFTSSREAISPDYQAWSDAARIYYGHGTRQVSNAAPTPPILSDFNFVNAGMLGQPNTANEFASTWSLVRHQCLLVDPRQTHYDMKPALGMDPSDLNIRDKMVDKDGQVALQPAGQSVFRHLAPIPQRQPVAPPVATVNDAKWVLRTGVRRMASGLVDVVTQTLRDVRDVVTAARQPPNKLNKCDWWYTSHGPDPAGSSFKLDNRKIAPFPVTYQMQAWMDDAWPTQSDGMRGQFENMIGSYGGLPIQIPTGGRMRVEPRPAHLLEVIRGDGKFNTGSDLKKASDYRVDQLELAANGFLRGCSEFIVDWSFGETDPKGELVWYGLSRFADLNGDGTQQSTEPWLTRPFPYRVYDDQKMDPEFTFPYISSSGKAVDDTKESWASNGGTVSVTDHVTPELIYGFTPATAATPLISVTSYFGYDDPTGAQGRPWAWPEFVRVTLRLVDPQDSNTELTYQFVFRTPGNAGKST